MRRLTGWRWPPGRTGLRAPFLSALVSRQPMPPFGRVAAASAALGVGSACVVLLMDRLFFGGVSLPRIRAIGALPLWVRALVPAYSAVTEEVVYRLGIMTAVVWLAARVRRQSAGKGAAWLGILVAAIFFGLSHVANAPDAPHPFVRALTLNGFAGTVLGWLYWRLGFEAAVLGHLAADVFIYLVVASTL